MQMSENEVQAKGDFLLTAIRKAAIAPEEVQRIVHTMKKNYRAQHPAITDKKLQDAVAKSIVDKYTWLASISGGATALPSVIPGVGTVLAVGGGATADIVICMKLQVDMCMCLAQNYDYDITSADGQNLAFLIAGCGALGQSAAKGTSNIASKAGVKMIHQYLKGAVLQTIKEIFKKVGITFTRKALEKAIPFGIGVLVGAGANYALSLYIGKQAIKWFQLDREDNHNRSRNRESAEKNF